MPIIFLETSIHSSIELCFDLSRSIDLHQISTARSGEKAIAGRLTGLIGLHEQVVWQATHFGIRQNLCSEITRFERPFYFRDEMISGAFKSYLHDHIFESAGNKVIMKDIFNFESPGGPAGRLFNFLALTRYMRKLLAERNTIIKSYAETDLWKTVLNGI
jgi:ligand-binding SRPBCC domain-containing protein